MADCSAGQHPFVMLEPSYHSGASAAAVCAAYDAVAGGVGYTTTLLDDSACEVTLTSESGTYNWVALIGQQCTPVENPEDPPDGGATTINCGAACTVTMQVEPAPAQPENIADYGLVAGLFLVTCIVIYCARGILRIFESTPHHGD